MVTPSISEDALTVRDGTRLVVRRFEPEGKPEAVILALHGFGGFGEVFRWLAEDLNRHGYAVWALDQRGFGDSPRPDYWPNSDVLVDDFRDFARAAKKRLNGTPKVALGVSMGGAAVLSAAGRAPLPLDGVVLAAPAARGDVPRKRLNNFFLTVGSYVVPFLGQDFEHGGPELTPEANRLMREDPRVVRRVDLPTYAGILRLADSAFEGAARLDLPTLLLYGDADPVLPPEAIQDLRERITAPLEVRVFKGGKHNLVNQEGLPVAQAIADFLDGLLAGPFNGSAVVRNGDKLGVR